MKPPLEQNYYELLEVPRDATLAEIDRAYDRARAYYGAGSVAVYTLIPPEELKQVQERIDEAYLVLADESARVEYDARIGPPTPDERPLHREVRISRERGTTPTAETIPPPPPATSREPAPPAASEDARPGTPILGEPAIAPVRTPTPAMPLPAAPAPEPVVVASPPPTPTPKPQPAVPAPEVHAATPPEPMPVVPAAEPAPAIVTVAVASEPEEGESQAPQAATVPQPEAAPRLVRREIRAVESTPTRPARPEISAESIFSGELLRSLRESLGLSLQEVSDRTKISKGHLDNIEADRYAALPAHVYLRGFLMSYARELKLDPLRVAKSYLDQVAEAQSRGGKPRG